MRRPPAPVLVATGVGLAVAALASTTATWALFTDYDVAAVPAPVAAVVSLGGAAADLPALDFPDMLPGEPRDQVLRVEYAGTVPARIRIGLAPSAPDASPPARGDVAAEPTVALCGPDSGASVLVQIGTAPAVPYCDLLGAEPVDVGEVRPGGAPLEVPVSLTLTSAAASGLPVTWSDAVVIEALGGFTDSVTGTFGGSAAPLPGAPGEPVPVAPPELVALLTAGDAGAVLDVPEAPIDVDLLPEECRGAGLRFTAEQVVLLTPDDPTWDPARLPTGVTGPLLIFGTAGDDDITGTGHADCVVAGDGDDRVDGGGGADVLLGGAGSDTLVASIAATTDAEAVDAGAAVEALLDGGPDGARCEVAPGVVAALLRCDPPAPPIGPAPVLPTTTRTPAADQAPPMPTGTAPSTEPAVGVPPAP